MISLAALLRQPDEAQTSAEYVKVTPIVAGTFTLPEHAFVSPADEDAKRHVPSLSFLIEHRNHRVLFDLGLRGKPEAYVPDIQAHLKNRRPITHNAVSEILHRHGIDRKSIDAVVLSHMHWDHHGDPAQFPEATFIVGCESLAVLNYGLPGRGSHSHFDPKLFEYTKVVELSDPLANTGAISSGMQSCGRFAKPLENLEWDLCGPFGVALDLFQDGSLFLVPAPGHLPGHINLLCRIGVREWMYLAGDAFHDERLLSGEKEIATWENQGQRFCIHFDKQAAEATIMCIREFRDLCQSLGIKLDVVAAHDCNWLASHREDCLE